MAHIHLPDGTFSMQWVAIWFALSAFLMGLLVKKYHRNGGFDIGKLSTASILTALAFAIFQIEIPLFGGVHLNLTPLLGIVLGPVLGCSSALIVNIFSAALGHGGWSMLGANFLVNSAEVVVSYYLFNALAKLIRSRFSQTGISTILALTVGNFVMVGIITVSGIQGTTLTSLQIAENLLPLSIVNIALALVEGVVTAFAVTYIARVKPELLSKTEQIGGI
jgi:cobalt/nickel transport system permease protein